MLLQREEEEVVVGVGEPEEVEVVGEHLAGEEVDRAEEVVEEVEGEVVAVAEVQAEVEGVGAVCEL